MGKRTKLGLAIGALTLSVCATLVAAQSTSNLPRANTVVKPRAYVSLEPVPRGRTFEVAIVAEIQNGFHINANKVLEEYLIPTSVTVELPKGFQLVETVYPPGKLEKFEFSDGLLNVYQGTVTLRLKLRATDDAPLGTANLPVTLRYQACNDRACLPPVRLNVPVDLQVAAAGATAKSVHPEVFPKNSPPKKR